MSVKIQLRRDTASNWANVNPTLAQGEMGVELDTNKFKFGNGTTAWNSLPYAGGGSGDIPTKLSQLSNDVGFITISDVEAKHYALQSELPTKTSQLTNDSNYITLTDVQNDGYTKNKGTVTSVNNTTPNAQGNVTIDIPDEVTETTVTNWGFTKNAGTVKSVNGNTPDAQGNVTIEAGDGSVKTVNDVEPDANGNVELDIPSKTSDLTNDSDFLTATVASSTYATKEEISKSGCKVLEGKITLPDTYELPFDVIKKDKIYTSNVDEDQLVPNPTTVYITVEGTPGEEGSGDGSWEDIKPVDWYNIALSTDAIGGTTRYFTYTTSNNARLSSASTVIGTKNVIPTDTVQEALNSYGIDVVAGDQIRLTVASGYATAAFIWNSDTMAVDGTPAYIEGTRTITIANGYNKIGIVLKKTSNTAISTTDAENLAIEKYIPGSVANDGTDKTKPIKLSTFRNNLTAGAYNNDSIKLVFLNKCNLYTEKSTFSLLNSTDSLKNLMITGENAMTWIGLGQDAVWTASSTAGCYQVECTTKVSDLADVEHLTALGMPKLYKKLSTVSAVAAEKGTFCQVSNIVTVNPYDATPINDIKLIYGLDYASTDKGVIAIEKSTAGNVVFKGMGFLLDTLNVSNLKSLNCALWFFNCGFHRNSQDSIGFNGLYQAYLVNCVADYASKDCFNYHSTSKDCIAAEFNCISYGAGQYKLDTTGHNTTTDSNNGSTAHNGLTIMRFGCQYWDCEGAIIADVHNCKVLNMECVAKHVLPTITSTNYNAIFMMHDNRNATSSGINKKYREDTHTNYIICCGGLDARNKYDIEGMTVEISGYDTDITSSYTVDETITNTIKYY